ncbi:MAG: TetR/AcrR family transcriptional regulator [Acidimicrobiia bacterium]
MSDATAKQRHTPTNRRHVLLAAAARCFYRDGFAAASMRDIAAEAGMQTASIYYHFDSKDDLLTAVHEDGLRTITAAVTAAIQDTDPGWARLGAACRAHLATLLEGGDFFKAVMRQLPREFSGRDKVMKLRDDHERIFTEVISQLDLAPGTDLRHLRLMLLGAMNWCFTWYHRGAATPTEIADRFVEFLRVGLDRG